MDKFERSLFQIRTELSYLIFLLQKDEDLKLECVEVSYKKKLSDSEGGDNILRENFKWQIEVFIKTLNGEGGFFGVDAHKFKGEDGLVLKNELFSAVTNIVKNECFYMNNHSQAH
jgi:hypothetical protein